MLEYGLAEKDEPHLLGHLDVSKSQTDGSTFTVCPPRSAVTAKTKNVHFRRIRALILQYKSKVLHQRSI